MSQAKQENCLFCDVLEIDRARIVEENDLAFVVRDGFPVTQSHTLLIPKRHVLDYFGLNTDEVSAIHVLLHSQKKLLSELDTTIAEAVQKERNPSVGPHFMKFCGKYNLQKSSDNAQQHTEWLAATYN